MLKYFVLVMNLLLAFSLAGCPGEIPVVTTLTPDQGITIQQVEFDFPGGNDPNSTWGRMLIDPEALAANGGVKDGFVSLITEQGWAVVNVPVPAPGEPAQAIFFDLGLRQSTPIDEIQVEVKHSNLALEDVSPYLEKPLSWAVDKWVWQAQGVGPVDDMEIPPPKTAPYVFPLSELPILQAITFSHLQAITNIQCAWNQCFPMATANGLQFLEDTGAVVIKHDHAQGIGVPTDPSSEALVGQLDMYANRSVTSRLIGNGVWFAPMINGTFEYLMENGLTGDLTFSHQDDGYPGGEIPAGTFTAFGSTSVQNATTIDWNWIDDRIQDGCSVVMVYIAHAVRITGSGKTLGRPWIRYSHDSSQSNDAAGLENVITFLSDTDSNALLNMDGSSNELRWVWAACP